jgi:CheY-like chemotaxis protein
VEPNASSPGSKTSSQVVLVVDDDRDIRSVLGEVLEDEGYATAAAPNGSEALRLLRAGLRPCVILLDLTMPGMDGWDFRADQLRDPDLSAIPVVVITAAGFRAETIQGQLGGVGFIRKPLPLEDVLVAVAQSCTCGQS